MDFYQVSYRCGLLKVGKYDAYVICNKGLLEEIPNIEIDSESESDSRPELQLLKIDTDHLVTGGMMRMINTGL